MIHTAQLYVLCRVYCTITPSLSLSLSPSALLYHIPYTPYHTMRPTSHHTPHITPYTPHHTIHPTSHHTPHITPYTPHHTIHPTPHITPAQHDGPCGMIVVASAGTVSGTAFDNLLEIRRICDQHSAWLHVDAAFGIYERLVAGVHGECQWHL
jgi:hypothetical protein